MKKEEYMASDGLEREVRLRYRPLCLQVSLLGEEDADYGPQEPGERFLQAVWNERHLREPMRTVSGKTLSVLSPGTWNVSGGPDFTHAKLMVEGKVVSGDVEIHRVASDWIRHGHPSDPAYRNVVLHGVWQNDRDVEVPGAETLVMSNYLKPSWQRLLWDTEDARYAYAQKVPFGECARRWAALENDVIQRTLAVAGLSRMESRGDALTQAVRERGADQALYEAVFDGLGYKSNRTAFRMLAEQFPLVELLALKDEADREAMLFGMAGLLADPTREPVLPEWVTLLKDLWNRWWSHGAPRLELPWSRSHARPYNSPCRRLAAGLAWLRHTQYAPARWLHACSQTATTPKALLDLLLEPMKGQEQWRGCVDFCHRIRPPADLLGLPRRIDIVGNVILPYLHRRPTMEPASSPTAAAVARDAFLLLPRSQENRLLKEAVQRFFMPPSRCREVVDNLSRQQGLLDIYRRFCLTLDMQCDRCPMAAASDARHEPR